MPPKKKPPPAEPVDKALVGIVKVPGVEEEIRNLTAVIANQKPENGGDDSNLIKAIESHAMAIRDHASVVQGNTDAIGDQTEATHTLAVAINRVADALESITSGGKATRITLSSVEDEPPHGGS